MFSSDLSLNMLQSSQPLSSRSGNRSRSPESDSFRRFMSTGWAVSSTATAPTTPLPVAPFLPARHASVSRHYPGCVLVVPAGSYKTLTADTDYPFRPHSAFVWLTGIGGTFEPDSAVVLYPLPDGSHESVLYFEPPANRESDEFYADARYGEFWVGARPSMEHIAALTGLQVRPLSRLADDLGEAVKTAPVRIVRNVDSRLEDVVSRPASDEDSTFEVLLNTLRMWKDEWEVDQLQDAVNVTKLCFEEVIRVLPELPELSAGERWAEVAFDAGARRWGAGTAFGTIAAAGANATTLHYMDNSAPVKAGDLLLVDAGAQVESLYGGDITRTLPVSGSFSTEQRLVYEAVLGANEAAFAAAQRSGCVYREMHDAAVLFLAEQLARWGVLPCSVDEAVSSGGQYVRRWMPHGTGHHLGLDTHECSLTPRGLYLDSRVEPGMVFTIEPGLYFRMDDELVPPELRGIGVRIEDNVLVTESGAVRLSEDIPRSVAGVEAWIREIQSS